MRESIPFVSDEMTDVWTSTASLHGDEPLPEPYESVARMVYGDRGLNEAFIVKRNLCGCSLQRWREHPEMIARVRFLARSRRQKIESILQSM